MTAQMTRRQFFKVTAGGVASVGLGALGLSPELVQAATRPFKLERTTEARNICPYCSVSCGVLMYSLGDKAKTLKQRSSILKATLIIRSIVARYARKVLVYWI